MSFIEWNPGSDNIDETINVGYDNNPYIYFNLKGFLKEANENSTYIISEITGTLDLNGNLIKAEDMRRYIFAPSQPLFIDLRFDLTDDEIKKIEEERNKQKINDLPINIELKYFIIPEIYNFKEIGFEGGNIQKLPRKLPQFIWKKLLKE